MARYYCGYHHKLAYSRGVRRNTRRAGARPRAPANLNVVAKRGLLYKTECFFVFGDQVIFVNFVWCAGA